MSLTTFSAVSINFPIIHDPAYIGRPPFILGSGNLIENGTAYSYVRINSTGIEKGETFTAYPAMNVGFRGKGIQENNFTIVVE